MIKLTDLNSQPVGSHARWWCCGQRYSAVTNAHYEYATLGIKRRGHLQWGRLQLGSGFDIQLEYSRKITLAGEIIGLNEDFDLTSSVARFLEINRDLIEERLFVVEESFSDYRRYLRKEFRWKSHVLTYGFLTLVYDRPRDPCDLAQNPAEFEHDSRVCQLMQCSELVFKSAYARLTAVSTSKAATWWYIFWVRSSVALCPCTQPHAISLYRTICGEETTTRYLGSRSTQLISILITGQALLTHHSRVQLLRRSLRSVGY